MSTLKYVVKKRDGTVYEGQLGVDIKKTLDRRGDRDAPQVVYECRTPAGLWVRVWTDECEGVDAELVQ